MAVPVSRLVLALALGLAAAGCDTNKGPGQNQAVLENLKQEARCDAELPPFGHFNYGDKRTGDPYAAPNGSIRMANDGGWCAIRFEHYWNTLQVRPEMRVVTPPGAGEVRVGAVGMDLEIAYRPRPGFTGNDAFRVHIDGPDPDVIPVRVEVLPG